MVGLEALDVADKRLFGQVLATVVDGDADGGGKQTGDLGGLIDPRSATVLWPKYQTTMGAWMRGCHDRTFSSARENPRPTRSFRLYLIVGHLTTGLRRSTGRGATAAALARRAMRLRTFLPGCFEVHCQLHPFCHSKFQCLIEAYLIKVTPDSALPILSEV